MLEHWKDGLCLEKLILNKRPNRIVECGSGEGATTKKLASLLNVYDFELNVISDKKLEGMDNRIHWFTGLSYDHLQNFEDNSVDLCIIDTDHNYWTLMKELASVFNKMTEGGLIAMHDVETFYHDTGMALAYWDGSNYPKEAIEECAKYGGLGDALIEFLQVKKMYYKLVAYTVFNHGGALIEKKTQNIFSIIVPGSGSGFAPKEAVAV